jgi:hypothetical protein
MTAEAKSPAAVPAAIAHPSGRKKHGRLVQLLRAVSFALYFVVCAVAYGPLFRWQLRYSARS